jgi:hypothetical protein
MSRMLLARMMALMIKAGKTTMNNLKTAPMTVLTAAAALEQTTEA